MGESGLVALRVVHVGVSTLRLDGLRDHVVGVPELSSGTLVHGPVVQRLRLEGVRGCCRLRERVGGGELKQRCQAVRWEVKKAVDLFFFPYITVSRLNLCVAISVKV